MVISQFDHQTELRTKFPVDIELPGLGGSSRRCVPASIWVCPFACLKVGSATSGRFSRGL